MANPEKSQLEVLLTCTVCQDIFQQPRQLPCGHSFCMVCLEGALDVSSDRPFRCPDCRAYFGAAIAVQKSYALANIAEDYRENQKTKPAESVYCDCCPEKESLAVRTCLKCEVSLCQEHVADHLELPVFTGHPLVKPLADLHQRRCPQHGDVVLRYYCASSRRYVCYVCAMESKHVTTAAEAANVLGRKLTEYMDQRFQSLEGHVKEYKDSLKILKEKIQNENQKVDPNNNWLNSVTVTLLCLWFIVLYYACSYCVENQTLTEMLDKQQPRLHHTHSTAAGSVSLDPDTASPFLRVSSDLLSVERVETQLSPPPGRTDRFDSAPQVLSAPCFAGGTHRWEVEAQGCWDMAVSYRSIPRKDGDASTFGHNSHSWSLARNNKGQLSAWHDKAGVVIDLPTFSHGRIGVTVDFGRGTVTFEEMGPTSSTLLYEFQAKLTQSVCLGLGLYRADPQSRASIIKAS